MDSDRRVGVRELTQTGVQARLPLDDLDLVLIPSPWVVPLEEHHPEREERDVA